MDNEAKSDKGIRRVVRRCRSMFQRDENTNHYRPEDFRSAERKFVKFCLLNQTGQPYHDLT